MPGLPLFSAWRVFVINGSCPSSGLSVAAGGQRRGKGGAVRAGACGERGLARGPAERALVAPVGG